MKKDYYEILGLQKSATLQEIKKKYRSLALKHHPDRVAEDKKKEAGERFKEISEAYGVLSDPEKRKLYDQYGHAGIDQNYTSEDIFRGADFGSIFEGAGLGDIFGKIFGGDFEGFGGGGGGQARRGRDIQYEVELTLEEAFTGVKKKIQVPRHEVCDLCNGSGAKTSADVKTCQTCGGRGQVMMASGFFRMAQPCPTCHGQGKVITDPCTKCHGQGLVRVTRKIEVNFPSGVDTDSQLRVRGEGEQAQGGKGDLYLYIRVKPHSVFTRSGNDLQMDLNMSFVKAALGAEVSVATLGGNVTMKIPEGTQSGKIFRLKGRGMPDLRSNAHPGDLYVRVMLTVPTKLSSEQRKLLEEYAQASGESVNKGGDTITEKLKKVFK